ncbi:serine/threonine-protein kinase [Streptomyces neyagawaensis]|uniref:serine/threonine-protein kinase n=1 Tax=Streptomyces neyagawaensis TaxID=42238 RepID=UPI0006E29FEC|nr:serine/threonine-protein kinase [Streptomyces neyagawaensis]MCL6737572.1 serine/threonine protein kinase [Streptomyces neyagawaensis]MDE1689021.1 serine/threonine-protein kinase [Streptomyces neyagawaensis]
MDWPGGMTRVGRYTIVGLLGGGGMGTVYLCRTPGGQRLAVKVIRADLAGQSELRLRFEREVAALREVNCPYTVPVYDAETRTAPLWLATRYVDGPTLAVRVREQGPLPAGLVRRFGLMLAEALTTVHERGVIHRDLKPSNIVLEGDEPRLIDFGIARSAAEASGLTAPGAVLGTAGYMAPEQLTGHRPTPAVDIFALGAVLTQAATGRAPFGTGRDANRRILSATRPDLDGVPGDLARLITACLSYAPRARPTPLELMTALTALADAPTRPRHAPPPSVRPPHGPTTPRPPHRCRVPGPPEPGGGCALRPAAVRLLEAGLTQELIRKALAHHDR